MKDRSLKSLAIALSLGLLFNCNSQKDNEVVTDSGLVYEILKPGNGEKAKEGDQVIVGETMGYRDGTVIHSTKGMDNLPKVLIGAGQAIAGVDEGLRGMQVGEIRKLTVPPSLSKRKQYPTFLFPDSILIYEIELVEIIDRDETPSISQITENEGQKSGFEMVSVEGGEFTMGGNEDVDDGGPAEMRIADECPHPVTVNDFEIGKYEITQENWFEVMGNRPSNEDNCDSCPVNRVSWDDIQVFIRKANAKYSENYRLPTEEEWEFAAKGGLKSKNYMYSGSNNSKEVAWFSANSNNKAHPVGLLKPNELGIYDMSGNIWEWCSNPKSPYPCDNIGKNFESKILRGGSFSHRKQSTRVIDRNGRDQTMRLATLGFRLAK